MLFFFFVNFIFSEKYAIIFAGSNGWSNYRHQADCFYMYQKLIDRGFNPSNIALFAYDDIADSIYNGYPGQVFHTNYRINVYPGKDRINFSGSSVNGDTLYEYLRNMKTTQEDTIFFYYNDHGLADLLGTPVPPEIYSWDFDDILNEMNANKKFKKMFICIEACYSGSFTAMLTSPNVIMLTASRGFESSYSASIEELTLTSLSNEFSELLFKGMDHSDWTISDLFNYINGSMRKSVPTISPNDNDLLVSDFIGTLPRSAIKPRIQIQEINTLEDITKKAKGLKKRFRDELKKYRKASKKVEKLVKGIMKELTNGDEKLLKEIESIKDPKVTKVFRKVAPYLILKLGKDFLVDGSISMLLLKAICTKYDADIIIQCIDKLLK